MNWAIELSPSEITVNKDKRQRTELLDIDELKASIKQLGQLQPIVITRDHVLVAGERRYTAVTELGDRPIRCVYTDQLNPAELYAIELEENIKRKDLPWKDECKAFLEFHQLKERENPAWTMDDTADFLNVSRSAVSAKIAVAEQLLEGNKLVVDAPKFSTAHGIVTRQNERRTASEVSFLTNLVTKPTPKPSAPAAATPTTEAEFADASIFADLEAAESTLGTGYILNENFKEWAEYYDGPKFNLIHCDFPYGVGMHKSDQGSGDSYGTYEDTPEIYWSLIDALLNNLDNFCEESAHLIFWFSMDYYTQTFELLSTKFRVYPHPLVWFKSDNSGILPDANRGPRRVYETAFFASRGDRKIVRPVSNAVASPIQRGRHMSEKPQDVLRHFLRMVVDEHSAVLDPTCGSGSTIRAAVATGASRYLGLEINPEFAEHADETLKQFLEEMEKEK